ncbi:uncharacterized protein LOC126375422 [Pectinophora gossypiella]|uniref:uncharacterized protein LOC126368248 n=2 Tax=Pectinophora gossypiella TaxID=13191 RepID=UPI00214ED784|nr:uncharacterized protein LOC126368248 [Pectinophora gossypiella]XP_049871273.1 uncharacterized protein LOC126370457 [Pectinophora gossypiella]XP_049877586.1 uncharacterized protein LOC126374866 [Pectinophora gossypiella]XP_049878293.1 uncharacterized protein LOC126375422 [Pectinophora gossypiella]
MTTSGKRGKVLRSDARDIVYNVIKYFQEEKNLERYHPFQYANARAAMATGLSVSTIVKIKKEGQLAEEKKTRIRTPSKGRRGLHNTRVPIDNFDICAIGNIVNSIYDVRKEVPTLNKILASAKKDLNFKGSKTTLRRILKNKLGYRFKKCRQNRSILIEKDNIKAWRARYLRRIRENDALGPDKKPVIYMDETWIHAHYTVSKCWQSSRDKGVRKNDSPGQRWVIVHAGSENGFVSGAGLVFKAKCKTGDYHDEMDGQNFLKYLNEKLIPNLPPSCILVLDNASYHSMQLDKAPTTATRKDDVKKFMKEHNITYREEWTKAELLTELKKQMPEKKYVVDELLKSHGHEVLRLPPYNCDLNPIEHIWNLLKQRVADKNVEQHENKIEQLTKDAISSITAEDWKKQINHIKRVEETYWTRDVTNETEIDDFIIRVGMDSSDDSSSETDTSAEERDSEMSGIEEIDYDDPGEGTSTSTKTGDRPSTSQN